MTRKREAAEEMVPLRRQYLQIKANYPDALLMFKLGDFYEFLDRDAEIAADILDIVLTGRDGGSGRRMPMAGVPVAAHEAAIEKLIAAGYSVAMCEQVRNVK